MIGIEQVLKDANCSDHPLGIDEAVLKDVETIYAAAGCNCFPPNPEGKTCNSYCDSSSFGVGRLMDGRFITAQEDSDTSGHG